MRPPTDLTEPLTIREQWAWPRIAFGVLVAVVALVLPGTLALIERPDNPGEGYAALLLAVLAFGWQGYRLAVSGFRLTGEGIRRLGLGAREIGWAEVEDLHWHTVEAVGGHAAVTPLHRLRVGTADGPRDLTRYPMRTPRAVALAEDLRALGVPLQPPSPLADPTDRPAPAP